MPRFLTDRSWNFLNGINSELINEVMDITVLVYKVNPEETKPNMYGESTSISTYIPVQVKCIVDSQDRVTNREGFGPNVNQNINFYFQRETLRVINLMPQIGDFIKWNDAYYEIDHVHGAESFGRQLEYKYSIRCETHMTQRTRFEERVK